MTDYRDHIPVEDQFAIIDARIAAICREAYSHELAAEALVAMGQQVRAEAEQAEVESLNIALGVMLARREELESA